MRQQPQPPHLKGSLPVAIRSISDLADSAARDGIPRRRQQVLLEGRQELFRGIKNRHNSVEIVGGESLLEFDDVGLAAVVDCMQALPLERGKIPVAAKLVHVRRQTVEVAVEDGDEALRLQQGAARAVLSTNK
jgi:hypothetical protein